MASESLEGKLALVTGASGGIGRASAIALAKRGCSIAVHYCSSKSKAEALVSEIEQLGVRAAAFQADLSDYSNVRRLHAEVVGSMGNPNVLFNNAGITNTMVGQGGNIESLSVEEFENTWKVNTGSSYLLTQLCIPDMVKNSYGRIIFCSSVAARTGGVVGPHYASSKSALHGLMHWVAQRYAKDGVTCNAVAPALILGTAMFNKPTEELKSKIPVGRFGQPEDIAPIVEMLATNSYMTNKIIVADGGWVPGGM